MWKATVRRFARVAVSAAIGAVWAAIADDPKMMTVVPIISAMGKAIREKTGWSWMPF